MQCRTPPRPSRAIRTTRPTGAWAAPTAGDGDPFLSGLPAHLTDASVAFMTHNVFIGLATTQEILAENGLTAEIVLGTTAILHPRKSSVLNAAVRAAHKGSAIMRLDRYEFADVVILEIRVGVGERVVPVRAFYPADDAACMVNERPSQNVRARMLKFVRLVLY
jgi:hypothetical protein